MAAAAAPEKRTRWAGMAPAERRTQRRAMVMEAAYDLLGTQGWSATTVRAVVERAGLNPRYFYESFADLDDLVIAVYDDVVDQLGAVVLGALEQGEVAPARQVRAVVEATVGFVDEDRRRGRVLYAEGLGNERLNRRRLDAGRSVVAFIEHYAAEQAPAAVRDGAIGQVGAAILVGGFSQLLIDWLAGRVKVGRDELVDDATELFLALGETAGTIASRRSAQGVGTRPRRRGSAADSGSARLGRANRAQP